MRNLILISILCILSSCTESFTGTYSTSNDNQEETFDFEENGGFTFSRTFGEMKRSMGGTFILTNDTLHLTWYDQEPEKALNTVYFRTLCFQEDSTVLSPDSTQIIIKSLINIKLDSVKLEVGLYAQEYSELFELEENGFKLIKLKLDPNMEGHDYFLSFENKKIECSCRNQNSVHIAIMNEFELVSSELPEYLVLANSQLITASGETYDLVKN